MPGPPPCRYCNLIFHYCREGAWPSAAHCLYCPLLPPGRPCRGGIYAARPTFPSQPLVPITTHPPNIHLAQKSLSKFVKKSEKTVDKSHTPCYNNQAVSRRTRREKRFITACICFLKKKFFKKLSENPLTIKHFWYIIYKLSRRRDSTAGPWKLNKTETCGTLNVGLETHDNQFQIYK